MRPGYKLIGLLVVLVVIFFVLTGLVCTGLLNWLVQTIGLLLTGWIWYLGRVIPDTHPDPAEVFVGVVCLAGVTVGSHRFAGWLYPAFRPEGTWRWQWTLRAVGAVVVTFVAGTAAVGIVHQTGWMLSSPEPLIEFRSGFRVAAARTRSVNNLKQIGLAMQNSAQVYGGRIPTSTFSPDGRPMHSWQTALLPYLEQESLYSAIKFDRAWDHPDNASAMAKPVSQFLHPGSEVMLVNGRGASHYAANVLTLGGDRPKHFTDFPQGLSNTLYAAEATANPRAWGDPLNWRDPRLGVNAHRDGFNGPDPRGINVLMGDGSARFVTRKAAAGLLTGIFDE